MSARSVVLVSLGSAPPGEALSAGVSQLRADGATVTLVSRVAPVPELATALDRHLPVDYPGFLRSLAAREPLRVGKLAVDPHRLPGAARILLAPPTRGVVRSADALVAVDAAALPAVWFASRLNRRALAVNGLPAALTRLSP